MSGARVLAVGRTEELGHGDLADDVALVTSELVTNAVLHAGGCTGIDISPVDEGVRVGVWDGSGVPPVLGHPSEASRAATPEAVAEAVLNEGVAALRAVGGGLLLVTEADRLAVPGAVGYDEARVGRASARSRWTPSSRPRWRPRTGEAVWLESVAERDARFPELVG